ncbi:MAG: hypothetical protein A2016_08995 [Elusimicrobia bacterium GWF2_62_30]|nr:MAG: hypothetical protein A2016_08995 [Elusimicrobia bacterium GWF2_62_30]
MTGRVEHGIRLGGSVFPETRVKDALKRFDWVYIGSEFCENLLDASVCAEAAGYQELGKKVCLLTPLLTERGVESLSAVFKGLKKLHRAGRLAADRLEITVNDFGALALAAREKLPFTLNAGRQFSLNAFVRQAHGIAVLNSLSLAFLAKRGISRYEFSSTGTRPVANYVSDDSPFVREKFSLTLYYPYLPLTTTRTCMVGMPYIGPEDSMRGIECRQECRACAFTVDHPWIKEKLAVRGNTVFLEFPEKFYSTAEELRELRIDRLVYCPFP